MNNIIIRKAKESDLPIIKKLMGELIEVIDNKEGIDINNVIENCRYLLNMTNSCILVAEIDEAVIGLINFTIRKTLMHSGPSGLIDELVITKNYQSKGVGQNLIYAAIEKCKERGCCEIEVSTEFTNKNAREFYRTCGFMEIGVILEKDLI